MNIYPIRTEADYLDALNRVDELMDAKLGTLEGDELEILSILIEKYEEDKYPIDAPDPIAAIKFRLEQLDMGQPELAEIVGANRASEILNGQRTISLKLVRKIHNELGIPYESLLAEEPERKQCASK